LGFAKIAWTLVKHRSDLFAFLGIQHGRHCDWDRCAFLETFRASFLETLNRVAYGLGRTTQDLGNLGRLLSVSTGKQNLATAQSEGILRTQTSFECYSF
jgi:hypothetical protein